MANLNVNLIICMGNMTITSTISAIFFNFVFGVSSHIYSPVNSKLTHKGINLIFMHVSFFCKFARFGAYDLIAYRLNQFIIFIDFPKIPNYRIRISRRNTLILIEALNRMALEHAMNLQFESHL